MRGTTLQVVQDGMVMFATPYEEKTKYYDFFWAGFIVQDLIEQADESKPRLTSFKADGIHYCQPLIMNSRWHRQTNRSKTSSSTFCKMRKSMICSRVMNTLDNHSELVRQMNTPIGPPGGQHTNQTSRCSRNTPRKKGERTPTHWIMIRELCLIFGAILL